MNGFYKMKIVADANIPWVAECFSSIGEVEVAAGREISPSVIGDAGVLLVRSVTKVNSALLAESSVRFVATATIGFEHVDIDYLEKNDIGFASAPGSNANSVAEYIVAGLLEIGEKHNLKLQGKSIGIVGVGNVGSRVAKKAKALGMNVYLNDPPLARQSGDSKYLAIEELYGCDFITLHTPLTFEGVDKTFHLADEKFFKSLKKGCVFFNTARGGVVDTQALKGAIKSDTLKATVLDVWENEPSIDTGLLEMVDIGTPHIAGYSLDGKVEGMVMIYKAVCEHFGLEPKCEAEAFLPKPKVPLVNMDSTSGDEQSVLRNAVEQIYKISEDDRMLRQMLSKGEAERGAFFDGLRKNYPVRREFQNTEIMIATEATEDTENKLKQNAAMKNLTEKLVSIGFEVKRQK